MSGQLQTVSARRRSRECDCGNAIPGWGEACPRCTFLDGRGDRERRIIGVLREIGAATFVEICGAFDLQVLYKGEAQRRFLKTKGADNIAQGLRLLVERGRIRKLHYEDHPPIYDLVSD